MRERILSVWSEGIVKDIRAMTVNLVIILEGEPNNLPPSGRFVVPRTRANYKEIAALAITGAVQRHPVSIAHDGSGNVRYLKVDFSQRG